MQIKNHVIYLMDANLIDVNQINNLICQYSYIKELDKNNNFVFTNDAKLHAISLFFIIQYLQTNQINDEHLTFNDGYYLIDDNHHYFSISHKNKYSAFISSNGPIGMDIEDLNQKIDINIAKKYFPNYIDDFNNENFLICWTRTEALLKCANIAFTAACKIINQLNNINATDIDDKYYFKTLKYKNMLITICHKHKLQCEYKICEIDYLPK